MADEEIKLSVQMDTAQVAAGAKAVEALGAAATATGDRLRDARGRFVALGGAVQQATTAIEAQATALPAIAAGIDTFAVEATKGASAAKAYAAGVDAATRANAALEQSRASLAAARYHFATDPNAAALAAVSSGTSGVVAGKGRGTGPGGTAAVVDQGSTWSNASAGALAYSQSLGKATKGAGSFNYQMMAAAQTLDDLQYVGEMGLRPILNNLVMISPAAGALAIVGNQIYKHWEPISTLAAGIGKEFGWISEATAHTSAFAGAMDLLASGIGAAGKAAKDWVGKELVDEVDALSGGPKRREKATKAGFLAQSSEGERADAEVVKKTIDSVPRRELLEMVMKQRAKASPDFAKEGDARETEIARIIGVFEKAQKGDPNAVASSRQLLKGTPLESKLADNDPKIQEQKKREATEYAAEVKRQEDEQERHNQEIADGEKATRKGVLDEMKRLNQEELDDWKRKQDEKQQILKSKIGEVGGRIAREQGENARQSGDTMSRLGAKAGISDPIDMMMMNARGQALSDPRFRKKFKGKTLEEGEQIMADRNAQDDAKLKGVVAKNLIRTGVTRDPGFAAGMAEKFVNDRRKAMNGETGDAEQDKGNALLQSNNEELKELNRQLKNGVRAVGVAG